VKSEPCVGTFGSRFFDRHQKTWNGLGIVGANAIKTATAFAYGRITGQPGVFGTLVRGVATALRAYLSPAQLSGATSTEIAFSYIGETMGAAVGNTIVAGAGGLGAFEAGVAAGSVFGAANCL
jgi:hypothetical protein